MSSSSFSAGLASNAFLQALQPQGSLHAALGACRPFDAIFVPVQTRLDELRVSTLLRSPSVVTTSPITTTPPANPALVSSAQQQQQSPQLMHFLVHFLHQHVVRFDQGIAQSFTTLLGHRGSISDCLDRVVRAGKLGDVEILQHLPPLPAQDRASTIANLPATLNIFLVSDVLCDEEELVVIEALLPPPAPASSSAVSRQTQAAATVANVTSSLGKWIGSVVPLWSASPPDPNSAAGTKRLPPSSPASSSGKSSTLPMIPTAAPSVSPEEEIRYSEFQRLMNLSESQHVAKFLRTFVEVNLMSVDYGVTTAEVRKVAQQAHMLLQRSPSWKEALDVLAIEGIERYLSTKLGAKIVASMACEKRDGAALHNRLCKLSGHVSASTLDVVPNIQRAGAWSEAKEELRGIHLVKTPREKLMVCARACEKICKAVTETQPSTGGADEFLPCVMLCVYEANSEELYLHLKLIEQIRSKLGDHEYVLTSLLSACEFWMTCTAQQLRMDERDFARIMGFPFAEEPPHVSAAADVVASSVAPAGGSAPPSSTPQTGVTLFDFFADSSLPQGTVSAATATALLPPPPPSSVRCEVENMRLLEDLREIEQKLHIFAETRNFDNLTVASLRLLHQGGVAAYSLASTAITKSK